MKLHVLVLTLFLLGLFQSSNAQTAYKIRVLLERVGVTHVERIQDTVKALLVYEPPYIGIYTGYDTLYLEELKPLPNISVITYRDRLHDMQSYYIYKFQNKEGFYISIIPLKPYKRSRLYGINLTSI